MMTMPGLLKSCADPLLIVDTTRLVTSSFVKESWLETRSVSVVSGDRLLKLITILCLERD